MHHETHHNDTQPMGFICDTQHNNNQHNDIQHNDIQQNDTQHNNIEHNKFIYMKIYIYKSRDSA